MTPLVIVCGPPASGKTTLADAIGSRLGLPVIAKDLVKERLMDHVGADPNLGAAAFAVQFAIARELLESGAWLVLEGAFFRDQKEIADIAALGDTVVVNVDCELEELERRYVERHGERHPAHRGLEAFPDLREASVQKCPKNDLGDVHLRTHVMGRTCGGLLERQDRVNLDRTDLRRRILRRPSRRLGAVLAVQDEVAVEPRRRSVHRSVSGLRVSVAGRDAEGGR
jgi:predicted kinase